MCHFFSAYNPQSSFSKQIKNEFWSLLDECTADVPPYNLNGHVLHEKAGSFFSCSPGAPFMICNPNVAILKLREEFESRALHGILLLAKVCAENGTFGNPCHYGVNVKIHDDEKLSNLSEKRKSLSDLIKSSVDYKVDPCEDFYQFACGNWIRNVRHKITPMGEYAMHLTLLENYYDDMREVLRSVENSSSKAIAQAATLYDKCISAEEEWKQNGTSMIHFLWKKIKEYGDFPMLSEKRLNETEISKKFNFTWLLAFFNRNKTVLHSIVPRVIYHKTMPSALLTFYPRSNIFTFMQGLKKGVKERFIEFMFNLIETVAADVGVDYGKTIAPKDIMDMVDFMEKLYATPVLDLDYVLQTYGTFRPEMKVPLFQLDRDTFFVNWTEYLLLVAPVEVHHYILSNPEIVADTAYVKRIDEALQSATPRTLTNFVITHYILSWLPVLEAKYRKLIYTFATNVGPPIPPRRSAFCFGLIGDTYHHALLAMYARSRNYGNDIKPLLEEMIAEIVASYKDQLNKNEWIDDEFRKGVFKKLDNMKSTLLYDEVSANDTALDDLYLEHLKTKDKQLPFLTIVDEVMYAKKKTLFYKLIQKLDIKKEFTTIAAYYDTPINAFYVPNANTMRIHFDHTGAEVKWYKDEWIQKFNKIIMCYVKQYNNKTIPIFNIPVNGTLTLPENVADNEGMKLAYMAFKKHQNKYGEDARTDFVEDFTNDQLFFLSVAMHSCTKTSDLTLYYQQSRSHLSSVFRVNNVALNTPAFASSFFCPPGSPMNPQERCSVW